MLAIADDLVKRYDDPSLIYNEQKVWRSAQDVSKDWMFADHQPGTKERLATVWYLCVPGKIWQPEQRLSQDCIHLGCRDRRLSIDWLTPNGRLSPVKNFNACSLG